MITTQAASLNDLDHPTGLIAMRTGGNLRTWTWVRKHPSTGKFAGIFVEENPFAATDYNEDSAVVLYHTGYVHDTDVAAVAAARRGYNTAAAENAADNNSLF